VLPCLARDPGARLLDIAAWAITERSARAIAALVGKRRTRHRIGPCPAHTPARRQRRRHHQRAAGFWK
jgi:hypothetical protein